ncbi:MAG: N-6 DNA methylase [Clostridia bacterium]|nr:N-6 DNA methylase [Clostridia bacterium]
MGQQFQQQLSFDYNTCFKEIYYSLYSNSNASRAESIVSDVSKILLFKFLSEQDTCMHPEECSGNDIIEQLSKSLPERYSKSEKFHLSDRNINDVLNALSHVNLSSAPSHIIGDAFQSMIGPRIRGDKGQFFTPKELVECMVSIIRPKPNEFIIDPACGTGGFLSEAISQMKEGKKTYKLVGIDKDRDMSDMALATTKILAGDHTNIYNANSLEILKEENKLFHLVGKADIVLTNPPFGAKIGITDESILKQYELGYNWAYSTEDDKWYRLNTILKNQAPQILFLELCIRLLKNGGRMATVLPEGIFGNKSLGYIWEYLRNHGKILAMIDCPRNTFQPSTDTKTNVLFFEKGKPFCSEVKVAIAKYCGHDKRGRTTTQSNEPWPNDFKVIADNYHSDNDSIWKTVEMEGSYCVPRYMVGKLTYKGKDNFITIGELMQKGYLVKKSSKEIGSEAYGTGDIPFIRTSDINNYEISADPTNSVSEEIYAQYASQQNLEVGDILFIADGRYRIGKTAIITPYNIKCLIQSHIEILSLKPSAPFSPYEFLYCLNSNEVQEQIRNMVFIQSTLGTLGSRINEVAVPIPIRSQEWNEKIYAFQANIETRAKCLFNLRETEHSFDL